MPNICTFEPLNMWRMQQPAKRILLVHDSIPSSGAWSHMNIKSHSWPSGHGLHWWWLTPQKKMICSLRAQEWALPFAHSFKPFCPSCASSRVSLWISEPRQPTTYIQKHGTAHLELGNHWKEFLTDHEQHSRQTAATHVQNNWVQTLTLQATTDIRCCGLQQRVLHPFCPGDRTPQHVVDVHSCWLNVCLKKFELSLKQ